MSDIKVGYSTPNVTPEELEPGVWTVPGGAVLTIFNVGPFPSAGLDRAQIVSADGNVYQALNWSVDGDLIAAFDGSSGTPAFTLDDNGNFVATADLGGAFGLSPGDKLGLDGVISSGLITEPATMTVILKLGGSPPYKPGHYTVILGLDGDFWGGFGPTLRMSVSVAANGIYQFYSTTGQHPTLTGSGGSVYTEDQVELSGDLVRKATNDGEYPLTEGPATATTIGGDVVIRMLPAGCTVSGTPAPFTLSFDEDPGVAAHGYIYLNFYPPKGQDDPGDPLVPSIPPGENPDDGGDIPTPPPDLPGGGGTGGGPPGTGVDTGPIDEVDVVWAVADPSIIAFGDICIGEFATQVVTLRNLGNVPVTIQKPVFSAGEDQFIVSDPPVIPLPAGAESQIGVYYTPTTEAVHSMALTMQTDDEDFPVVITASGEGNDCGDPDDPIVRTIRVDGDAPGSGNINFLEQNVDTPSEKTVKVTNTGNVPARITLAERFSGDIEFTIETLDITLDVDASRDITVTYSPTETGPNTAIMRIAADATNINPDGHEYFAVVGVAYPADEPITRVIRFDGPLTFGGVFIGDSVVRTFTIANIGTGSVIIRAIDIPTPYGLSTLDTRFSLVTNGDGTTTLRAVDEFAILAPTDTTDPITVVFSPIVAGDFITNVTATVDVGPTSPTTHPVEGIGVLDFPPDPPDDPDNPPDPDPGSDPPTAGESALDGVGNACVTRQCELQFLYEYRANKP